jgi:hypothetical protein
MNEKDLFKLLEAIRHTLKCPLCARLYEQEEIKFLGTFNAACLLEMNCQDCGLAVMATVLINNKLNGDKPSINIREKTEAPPVDEEDIVTSDEIINVHKFLKNFDGDFKKAFTKKRAAKAVKKVEENTAQLPTKPQNEEK